MKTKNRILRTGNSQTGTVHLSLTSVTKNKVTMFRIRADGQTKLVTADKVKAVKFYELSIKSN